jgi:hypothetical protein
MPSPCAATLCRRRSRALSRTIIASDDGPHAGAERVIRAGQGAQSGSSSASGKAKFFVSNGRGLRVNANAEHGTVRDDEFDFLPSELEDGEYWILGLFADEIG